MTQLARTCPRCGLIAHYDVVGRSEVKVECYECETIFCVKKYRKGERPKPIEWSDEAMEDCECIPCFKGEDDE